METDSCERRGTRVDVRRSGLFDDISYIVAVRVASFMSSEQLNKSYDYTFFIAKPYSSLPTLPFCQILVNPRHSCISSSPPTCPPSWKRSGSSGKSLITEKHVIQQGALSSILSNFGLWGRLNRALWSVVLRN